jgi:hypothetical protein
LEGTFENVMNKAYSNSGLVRAYLVKPGVWNPGWCTGSTPYWSDLYWPTAPSFDYCRSDTMSAGQSSVSYRYQAVWL